ncbi:MAG TPA: hypothetical protein ENI51_02120 [Candidatus Atribacteria bacterium]|nr:hypothetical protein [Candidatus Atribacteria bacterium]
MVGYTNYEKIDLWLRKNNLNIFGDPKGTMYAGGSPLFDERTGRMIDRYQYIFLRHSELLEKLKLRREDR